MMVEKRPAGRRLVRAQPLPEVRPTVSVVIPCYNYARFLPGAVRSAFDQPDVEVDVVVVDDASTDDSLRVARGLADEDPRITVLSNASNAGPVTTFNRGLSCVTGTYVVRLDADDLLTPGSLSRATAAAEHLSSAGLVYGHPRHFTGSLPTRHASRVLGWRVWEGRQWLADRCRDGYNVITSPEVLMRTSVVQRVGGQRQELRHAHDMEMWFRLAAVSDVVYLVGPDQALHRDHPDSLSTRQSDPLDDLAERALAFEVLFAAPSVGALPDAPLLRRRALESVARSALDMACHGYDRRNLADDQIERLRRFAVATAPEVVDKPAYRALNRRLAAPGRPRAHRLASSVAANTRSTKARLRHLAWSRGGTYDGR